MCMCTFPPLLLSSSKPLMFTPEQVQCSWSTHASNKGNEKNNQTGCEMMSVQSFKSASATLGRWPPPAARVVLKFYRTNQSLPPLQEIPPWPSSARWRWQPRLRSSFVTNMHLLICIPPKHRTPPELQLWWPQAGLGPGANKTLKPHNWDHSAQYSLSLYSPVSFLHFPMDNSAQEPLYHGCESQSKLKGGKMWDDKVARHFFISFALPGPLLLLRHNNIISLHILAHSDLLL